VAQGSDPEHLGSLATGRRRMIRRILGTCLVVVLPLALTAVPAAPVSAATAAFVPVADAYVSQAAPKTKYGTATDLKVSGQGGQELRTYLRFSVNGLTDSVAKATLRLSPSSAGTAYQVRSVTNTTWSERGVTWNNAPAMSSTVTASSQPGADGWAEVDVTPLVSGNGLVSFGLTSSRTTVDSYASREVAARAPRLVIETAAPPSDTAAPVVTLVQPAAGSVVSGGVVTYSGAAGTEPGDAATVTVGVYSGESASGTPVQTLSASRDGGSWTITASSALAAGTYTARAEQLDEAGNVGRSGATTFSVGAPSSSSYRSEVLADSPAAYWRLDETSGTTAGSETSTDAGTYQGGYTLGQPGALVNEPSTAALFNGTTGTVNLRSSAGLNPTTALTLEGWVKPTSLPATSATIIRKDAQYLLRITGSGGVVFRVWKGGSAREVATGSTLVRAGQWSHVVGTWDGSTMTVYVNGTARGSASVAAPIDSSSNPLYLASVWASYDWVNGSLDEVAVYGTALPAARVQSHYVTSGQVGSVAGPDVTLMTPTQGSAMDSTPNFGGFAGTAAGDGASVTVKVYAGSSATGTPARTLTASAQPMGTYSVRVTNALMSGTYTAQVEQTNTAGGIGKSAARTFTVDAAMPPVLLAAGDIAGCDTFGDEATALLLDGLPGTVAAIGDLAYQEGTAQQFAQCYDPTWGRHKARTRPAVGDHEYLTPNASGYFGYWGATAGDPTKGYYSYDLGSWHVVVLNTVCSKVGGCQAGSPEEQWLRADLAANPAQCTIAYIHHPRFSSGNVHGSNEAMRDFWRALYDHGAEVVLSGDEHVYERFAPQTPDGVLDSANGIRQFTVGTGGRLLYGFGTILPNSQARNSSAFGILKLTLGVGSYNWQFVPEAGKSYTDTGSHPCH